MIKIISPKPFEVIQRFQAIPLRHPFDQENWSNGFGVVPFIIKTSLTGHIDIHIKIDPIGLDPIGLPPPSTINNRNRAQFYQLARGQHENTLIVHSLDIKRNVVVVDGYAGCKLYLPAGGWYRCSVTINNNKSYFDQVGPFGIGEVYIIGGQSLAGNNHDALKTITDIAGRVTTLDIDSGEWRIGNDPQPINASLVPANTMTYWQSLARDITRLGRTLSGGSIWPPTMNLLFPAIGVPIGMVNVSVGGTSIMCWKPGSELFNSLVKAANLAKHFRAILWQQGETDAFLKRSTSDFVATSRLIRESLAKATSGRRYDWIIAKSTHFPATHDDPVAEGNIRAAIDIMANEDDDVVYGPDTDCLRGHHRAPPGTSQHLSSQGQDAAGALWFSILLNHINSNRKTASFL